MTDLQQMLDLETPWCLHVAATLSLTEHIRAGHRDIADLAEAVGCDRDALHALLGYLVGQGVFTEDAPGRFACNEAADQLAEARQFLDLDGIGGRMAHAWGTMLGYVRTGKSGYAKRFGLPFWEDLAANPRVAASFDELMGPAGHGVPDFDIELSRGWDGVESIMDVGGGTGAMLANLLRHHPGARGILLDLPGTIARADLGDVADRVSLAAQSFFDPLPAGADVYLLSKVLNDWPDAETVAILRRCAEAATGRTALVVMGGVAPDDARPSLAIDMLVVGGKTSSLSRFAELAGEAGLTVAAAGDQNGRYIVECALAGQVG